MKSLKLSLYLVVWAFFYMKINLAHAQFYIKDRPQEEIEKNISNNRFDMWKFRLSVMGGVLHKKREVFSYRPLLNNTPFSSLFDPNLTFTLAYKHTRWICPEILYRSVRYNDGDLYIESLTGYPNLGSSYLFSGYEFGIGNRFFLVDMILQKPIRVSSSVSVIYSQLSGNIGYIGSEKLTITNINTSSQLVFSSESYQLATSNFLLSADLALEIQIFQVMDLSLGLAYYQGLNQISQRTTTYTYQNSNYSSTNVIDGSGLQPFVKLTFKFPEAKYSLFRNSGLRFTIFQ